MAERAFKEAVASVMRFITIAGRTVLLKKGGE
jgi:hypothetical protein